jgi:hypothetical protein
VSSKGAFSGIEMSTMVAAMLVAIVGICPGSIRAEWATKFSDNRLCEGEGMWTIGGSSHTEVARGGCVSRIALVPRWNF